MKPLISVITISYNAEREIGKTIESVLAQNFTDYEYVFVDGASKDGTVAVIESYRERFEAAGVHYRVTSEPDKGIYDAMNKSVDRAEGEWLVMMNAGDCFADANVLRDMFAGKKYDADIVYGDTIQVESCKGVVYRRETAAAPADTIGNGMPFCHQSVFVRGAVMKEYGFDTSYKISADYDLFLRCYKDGKKFAHVRRVVSVFDCSGVSSSNAAAAKAEASAMRKKYGIRSGDSLVNRAKLAVKKAMRETMKQWAPKMFFSEKRGWHRQNEE